MTQQDLEERISRIEDIEAIKELMWSYTYSLDYGQLEEVMDKFVDDAKMQIRMRAGEPNVPFVGEYDNKEGIRGHFASHLPPQDVYPAGAHLIANPVVMVEGEKAKGVFYLLYSGGGGGAGPQGRYDMEYVKVGGKWKISSFTFTWNFIPEQLSES